MSEYRMWGIDAEVAEVPSSVDIFLVVVNGWHQIKVSNVVIYPAYGLSEKKMPVSR